MSFYYPVAVGGPITKIIDGFAADFEKENPGIKLKPIYSGSYQESITKALTAVKSGEPPVTSILLSTDMFTLIDEDAIVPFDDLIKTPDDRRGSRASTRRSWRTARPAARPGAFRSSARRSSCTTTRRCSRKRASTPTARRRRGRSMIEYAQKLTKRDASGKVTQWGVQIPSSGFPYWLFQALAIENGVNLMNSAGTQTYYDKPEVIEALQYWVDLVNKYKVHPEGIVEWGTTPKDFFERKVAMMWTTTGNLTNVQDQRQVRLRRRDAARRASSAAARPAAATSTSSRSRRRRSARPRSSSSSGSTTPQRAAQWGIDTGYVAVRADAWETPAMKQYVAGFPGRGGRARPVAVREGRAVDARQPARDEGAERRPAGGADRHQDARSRR